jgi:CRP-like cAMP-binding protein
MKDLFIAYLQSFRPIPDEEQELILDAFEERVLKEGDYLFRPGQVCRELFFIRKGVAKILVPNDKGIDVIYFFSKENQLCTLLNSFNNGVVAEECIRAATDMEVSAIHKARLLELYKRLPYLGGLIDRITQQRLLDKIRIRNAYMGQDASSRYRLFMTQEPEIALRVPLNDIASYLGITPQSLSRIRRNHH